jgi:hypothetical protein
MNSHCQPSLHGSVTAGLTICNATGSAERPSLANSAVWADTVFNFGSRQREYRSWFAPTTLTETRFGHCHVGAGDRRAIALAVARSLTRHCCQLRRVRSLCSGLRASCLRADGPFRATCCSKLLGALGDDLRRCGRKTSVQRQRWRKWQCSRGSVSRSKCPLSARVDPSRNSKPAPLPIRPSPLGAAFWAYSLYRRS